MYEDTCLKFGLGVADGFEVVKVVVVAKSSSLSSAEDEEEVSSDDISEPLSAKISWRISEFDNAISPVPVFVRTRLMASPNISSNQIARSRRQTRERALLTFMFLAFGLCANEARWLPIHSEFVGQKGSLGRNLHYILSPDGTLGMKGLERMAHWDWMSPRATGKQGVKVIGLPLPVK